MSFSHKYDHFDMTEGRTAIITFTYLLTVPLCIWSWMVQESCVGNVQLIMSKNFLALLLQCMPAVGIE